MNKTITAAILCCTMLPGLLTGCGSAQNHRSEDDIMKGITPNKISTDTDLLGNTAVAVTDFSVRLFQQSLAENENTLLSPLSVLCALAMTANGAEGNTRAQMEQVFGLPLAALNDYLHAYMQALPAGDKYRLSLANSVWFRDDDSLTIRQDFLQTNADYYGAGIYKAPFDDATLKQINDWTRDNTDGMIDSILSEISDSAVMYLINALAFDAEWQEIYNEHQINEGEFTKEDGSRQQADLMYSTEYQYLSDDNAEGFLKYYADEAYAFAALLPDEGTPVSEYAASLTGERLAHILNNVQDIEVAAAIPKFQNEYDIELSEVLKEMGMPDAFDDTTADFSGIGSSADGNLFINRVLHKTFITTDERGTKAGAATVVEMAAGAAPVAETKQVYLDRPFLYLLIDCKTKIPVFLGIVHDVN